MMILNLFLLFLLIALTAFFVASEFAMVKVRSSRIDQLIAEGNPKANAAKKVTANLDEYLSACQLGITITALGLGWLGEPTIAKMLEPIFEQLNLQPSLNKVLSFVIAFSVVTFLHVVIGELAPKTVAIQKAEAVTLSFAQPLIWFYKILFPFIWTLNHSARFVTSLFGLKPVSEHEIAHSEEELRIILSESLKSGEINQSEYKYVNNIFEFDNRIAKEIMVPRTEIVSLDENATLSEVLDVIMNERYTRYPITGGDKDTILGHINVKEILTDCIRKKCKEENTVVQYIKPVIKVIETIPIHDLLLKMQKERIHMAILFDEYGGTAGLVTAEDILEEIVGEIRDEFDADELPFVQKLDKDHYILDAKLLISETNDLLGTTLDEDEVDTLGGWILTQKFDLEQGEALEHDGYQFIIKEIEGHHILYIEVKKANAD
ncbi:hemolysin family protein [Bacillus sp. DTU_2020_1000418_1_SI_GHA_SEK_038]|uniref:hemolysin family protein n=1 Tax=Bacillus sp. DTU_2020_1000418_1_SI_GHA_SEK_038 TaxID=3077585 RepID=UPI0028E81A2D|nr:hemolysin family protein [Bacillus sp. DTU_2020_1000418_1_SI_GHA_SEK_038]WNS76726.1 hemolysin family protein [Bacillus sp. DTU_2020_1000418_1_SI_GHA_SEK_038]